MTSRKDDKRGNDEFGSAPDADYNRKVEARHTKETPRQDRTGAARLLRPEDRRITQGRQGLIMAKIEIEFEDLQRLYDLATDSPLIYSGSFETEDVRVLRRLGRQIGADLGPATPDEFVRDFPHAFGDGIYRKPMWVSPGPNRFRRHETEEEMAERISRSAPNLQCEAGSYNRRCGRDADHPLHQPDAPEPTSDPDAMIDE